MANSEFETNIIICDERMNNQHKTGSYILLLCYQPLAASPFDLMALVMVYLITL